MSVLYDVSDGIAVVTLNRPESLNAWTGKMTREYFDALERAALDPAVRAVIVTGAGRGFSSGADLMAMQGQDTGEGSPLDDPRPVTYAMRVPKPVVAVINGSCAGLGLVHAMMCDVRFAAAGAKFTTAFARRGLIAEHASAWLLPRLIGHAHAMDVLFSGRTFLAEEALAMGLVNKVYPVDELMDRAREYVTDVITNASLVSIGVMKQQVLKSYEQGVTESLEDAIKLMTESFSRPDFREGVMSWAQRRPPNFEAVAKKIADE